VFRKILVPLDGSALASKILDYLEPVLELETTSVVVLRVRAPGTSGPLPDDERLAALSAKARIVQIEREGDPASEILAAAEAEGASLLALSTHGRTGLARLVRGSVAERVLRNAQVPVLLVNPFTETSSPESPRRILVPLDGSPASAGCLDLVLELGPVYGAKVLLFHVGNPDYRTTPEGQRLEELRAEEFRTEVAPPLVARLEAAGLEVEVDVRVEFGPAGQILAAIEREGIDLVALTTHGRTGVSRWVYGSVAEALIRECRVPLLVKRVEAS
jgi:nucleotide-binding universal stress UspA family protein